VSRSPDMNGVRILESQSLCNLVCSDEVFDVDLFPHAQRLVPGCGGCKRLSSPL